MVDRARAPGREEACDHQERERERIDAQSACRYVSRCRHEEQQARDTEFHQLDIIRKWHRETLAARYTFEALNLLSRIRPFWV